ARDGSDLPGQAGLAAFLARNPDFAFGNRPVDHYLAENPEALTGITDPPQTIARMKAMQRTFALTPRYSEISALHAAGLTSGHHIPQMGRNTFVDRYAERLGSAARAEQIYDNAGQVAATTLGVLFGNRVDMTTMPVSIMSGTTGQLQIPDW